MKDIITDNGDLLITNGDFLSGESESQHVEHLMLARKGQHKHTPLSGVGIGDMAKAPLSQLRRSALERDIKLQLMAEGLQNVSVSVSPQGEINISRR